MMNQKANNALAPPVSRKIEEKATATIAKNLRIFHDLWVVVSAPLTRETTMLLDVLAS